MQSVDRVFLPGDSLAEQDADGHSMFLLVTGTVGVFSKVENWSNNLSIGTPTQKKATLNPGSSFGELAMLGVITKRPATIKADTFCLLWEFERKKVQHMLGSYHSARKAFVPLVLETLETAASQRFLSMRLFKNFGQHFKMLLGLECDRRVFLPHDYIVRSGCPGEGLYVVNVGEAVAKANNVVILVLKPGCYFGSMVMLGVSKACLTALQATTVCHVLILTHESYHTALVQYPAPHLAASLAQSEYTAHQELKEAVELIHEQSNMVSNALTHLGLAGHETNAVTQILLDAAFFIWLNFTRDVRAKRAETKRRSMRRWDVQSWAIRNKINHAHRVEKEHHSVEHMSLHGRSSVSCNTVAKLNLPRIPMRHSAGGMQEKMSLSARESSTSRQRLWQNMYTPLASTTPRSRPSKKGCEERRIIRDMMHEQDFLHGLMGK
jgi:CRP-like cAMP-binding protein